MRKLILALASLLTIVWSVAVLAVDVDHEQQAIKAATAVVCASGGSNRNDRRAGKSG